MDEEELKAQQEAEAAKAKEAEEAALKAAKETETGTDDGKPSDAEAKLIKEIMKLKAEKKAEAEKAKKLAEQLGGIDLDAAREALKKMEEAEKTELERKGEYTRLLEMQKEAAAKERKELEEKLETERKAREDLARNVDALSLTNAFSNSKFIQEKLTLTPNKTKALYADHFEIQDGKIVAYDKPKGSADRTPIVGADGEGVPFEAAIEAIINGDPDKDTLIKSELKGGAGSKQTSIETPGTQRPMSSLDKMALGLKNSKNFGLQNPKF
jgi:DNA-binding transcriptional ArsR family regulator